MPRKQPTLSIDHLRYYTERWEWEDPNTKVKVRGYNVPDAARKTAHQVPYFIRYLTLSGVCECGMVITLKLFRDRRQRLIKFVESGECRRICDILIIEADGVRFISE